MKLANWFGKHGGIGKLAMAFAIGLTLLTGGAAIAASNDAAPPSLYARLGGYNAIAAVVDDLVQRLAADPELGRFWANRGADGIRREKQLIVNFIVDRAGGPLFYSGRDMKISHVGMRISERDWQLLINHLHETLAKFKVPTQEKNDVLAFIESTRADIVEK